ncbi:AAA family ATPase [Cryptosporangium sp. NPDC051539]|uniref:AAA family ATPase n=1 Tax=Cryptosporangium sp. NPDC051539 TaxID=3363962 RepID=UPI003790E391
MTAPTDAGEAGAGEAGSPDRRATAARAGAEPAVAAALPDVESLTAALDAADYVVDPGLATALFLAIRLPQPVLLEGEPGVGKTEAAKALARALDTPLVRLSCYEGIDASEALYEWNYPRQLLAIRMAEAHGSTLAEADLFTRDYLLRRPLLAALEHDGPRPAVLLIDELDRADDDFEAFTFELLAEAAVTIPELGTITAAHPPIVVLTSNRTRDLHDALKRRCLYHWIDYPSPDRAAEIVRRRVPDSALPLTLDATGAVSRLRGLDLEKPPGIAETVDWVAALTLLGVRQLDVASADLAATTLGSVLKSRDDLELVRARGLSWLTGAGRA